jgi:ubiquinone/menaquinone biosynthesis C-methylase UbiE
MNYEQLYNSIGNVDIYVIDQILKNRYTTGQSILDAGCGGGRNLKWFYQNEFIITGIDANEERIAQAKMNYPKASENFKVATLDNIPFEDNGFDHILCCAVLHFSKNEKHFKEMFSELVRVLKPAGTLLIRVASNIGLDGKEPFVQDNGSNEMSNFYVTRELVSELIKKYAIELIEPVKTTNVQDVRAMTTLMFQKY